jgi:hypothetical protein
MEPVNHWQPVTTEYRQEPAPFFELLSQPGSSVETNTAGKGGVGAEREVPIGIACVTWFYFIRGCAYFVFASMLISNPGSNFASWLAGHSRGMVPFQVHATDSAPLAKLEAEALLIMAILSVVVGTMWMVRYWRIRWITMFYAGASLARTALYFITDRAAGVSTQLSVDQKQALLIGSAANLLILCYLAFYPGVEQAFESSH